MTAGDDHRVPPARDDQPTGAARANQNAKRTEGSLAPLPFASLKGDAAFRRVRQRGKSGRTGLLTIRWLPQRRQEVTVGIVASKKVGKAVVRNRLRRRIREAVRRLDWPACQATVVLQPEAAQASYGDLLKALVKAAAKSGLR
ncbi:MAG TPA: ribonuclease P protein component [Deinococcales bacterium]|nr:ribonuclease P protein component [Deinococcales bacterium]